MSVADAKYFWKENIEKCSLNASSLLAEQALYCLELVAELVECGLNYQFKGGNSLLLVLDEPKRFSIDVDIATDESKRTIERTLDDLVKRFKTFSRWEKRQHKTKPWLPMSSYYLFFRSQFDSSPDTSIMLDVQLRRSPYRTEFKEVSCGDLYHCSSKVELPLPSSIIADKLLTLGPATLGIPTGRGKEAQRLKHVYDVSRLLYTKPDVRIIRESFVACLKQENEIQNSSHDVMSVVKDTLSFCWSVANYSQIPQFSDNVVLNENIKGLIPFSEHLFEPGYCWSTLQRDMARVAVCISAAGNETITNDILHDSGNYECYSGATQKIANEEVRHYWEKVCSWWEGEMFWI